MSKSKLKSVHAKDKGPTQRQLRVGEELRHALSAAVCKNLPYEHGDFPSVTVTHVKVGPDLKNASVYVMTLGGERLDEVVDGLNAFKGYYRHMVSRQLTLKFMPQLKFKPDLYFDRVQRIHDLLRSDHVAQDLS